MRVWPSGRRPASREKPSWESCNDSRSSTGCPEPSGLDNGPEFTSKLLGQWACLNGVELDFSRPGKPTDNAFIEAFNGRFRQECLNENWFLSLADAEEKVETWRNHYSGERPDSALGNLSQRDFAVLA